MNNSKLIENFLEEENQIDNTPLLRKRLEELTEIIEAIDAVSQSNYYRLLEEKVFKDSLNSFVNQLCNEKDNQKVAWLQGAIAIISKYADFRKFSEAYRLELERIKQQLKGREKQ